MAVAEVKGGQGQYKIQFFYPTMPVNSKAGFSCYPQIYFSLIFLCIGVVALPAALAQWLVQTLVRIDMTTAIATMFSVSVFEASGTDLG